MNFGHKIIIAFILFISLIGFLAYRSIQEKIDLVAENYYEQEINFQNKIDEAINFKAISDNVIINENSENLSITFINELKNKTIKGELEFYNPSDKSKDLRFPFEYNGNKVIVNKKLLAKGRYQMKLEFSFDGEHFFTEKNIMVN
jgi:nitrogen fixation protein FixH